jgi:hypothetical protein
LDTSRAIVLATASRPVVGESRIHRCPVRNERTDQLGFGRNYSGALFAPARTAMAERRTDDTFRLLIDQIDEIDRQLRYAERLRNHLTTLPCDMWPDRRRTHRVPDVDDDYTDNANLE